METKFIAVMGPSGVGKSTIMHALLRSDGRFVMIKTHVTRPLRPGEDDRISLPLVKLMAMSRKGEVLKMNHVYYSYYAALPKKPIEEALAAGMFPMCDYKIPFVGDLKAELQGSLFSVYLIPPNPQTIINRLGKAGRKIEASRILEDSRELASIGTKYSGLIDLKIVNEEDQVKNVAKAILAAYLKSLRQ